MDTKGYCVDTSRSTDMDTKSCGMDTEGYYVDTKGYDVNTKGYNVDVTRRARPPWEGTQRRGGGADIGWVLTQGNGRWTRSPPVRAVCGTAEGLDTDTVKLTVKPLFSHLVTREFNSPTNSLRTSYVRVEPRDGETRFRGVTLWREGVLRAYKYRIGTECVWVTALPAHLLLEVEGRHKRLDILLVDTAVVAKTEAACAHHLLVLRGGLGDFPGGTD
eukprot:1187744-Prorocentrum_minimum.AAC.1